MDIQSAIQSVIDKKNLSNDDMRHVMKNIMTGECTDAQIAGFLVGLRSKGETVDEITAAAHVMRELASKVHINQENLIDTCGTGGDDRIHSIFRRLLLLSLQRQVGMLQNTATVLSPVNLAVQMCWKLRG